MMEYKSGFSLSSMDGYLIKPLKILSKVYGFNISDRGIDLTVEFGHNRIEVFEKEKGIEIKCPGKVQFFRAFGLVVQKFQKNEDNIRFTENIHFDSSGVMIDCSRNAVPTTNTIKEIIKKMAVMGLSSIMLYTEDTIKVEGFPYIGYMRGGYTREELKEMDEYAQMFGIEISMFIQTLGHMEQILKWDFASDIKDTDKIILADCEKSYELLENIIKTVSDSLDSRKICIGMDEAYNIGLGNYLKKHGYTNKIEIMERHLKRILNICKKYGLKAYMASDMYFILSTESILYHETKDIPEKVRQKVPEDVCLAYWDYYFEDKDHYTSMIDMHRKISDDICFVGGIMNWEGMAIKYSKTINASDASLSACKQKGIKEVYAAVFGDDGDEGNLTGTMLGMQFYAEHTYSEKVDETTLNERFMFTTGCETDDFKRLEDIDLPVKSDKFYKYPPNPSKYLLYQDLLLGMFDTHVCECDYRDYYQSLADDLRIIAKKAKYSSDLFLVHSEISGVLEIKAQLGVRIKKYYDEKDRKGLKCLVEEDFEKLLERIESLRNTHQEMWMNTFKPFGWEVLDLRYGGLYARVKSARKRINMWIDGKIENIPELEEERLDFVTHNEEKTITYNTYSRIVSPGVM